MDVEEETMLEEVCCLNEMPLDEMIEQGQREVAFVEDKIKTISCEKVRYYIVFPWLQKF